MSNFSCVLYFYYIIFVNLKLYLIFTFSIFKKKFRNLFLFYILNLLLYYALHTIWCMKFEIANNWEGVRSFLIQYFISLAPAWCTENAISRNSWGGIKSIFINISVRYYVFQTIEHQHQLRNNIGRTATA